MRRGGRKALIPFVTAGHPSLTATARLIPLLERAGADIIELGMPFSDPMADGPVIQRASERALKGGVTLGKILQMVRGVSRRSQVPLVLMGYYNPILSYGLRRYAKDSARAGVDGTLVVDLPPEEAADLDRELRNVGISLIYLLTPTSDRERIEKVARRAQGFIYFVSMTGITGARLKDVSWIRRKVTEIRRETSLPIAVGFGIRTPRQAAEIARVADGVVVGSAVVELLGPSLKRSVGRIEKFVKGLRKAIDR